MYFENKKKPWETIYSPLPTPQEIVTRQDRILFRFVQQFKQYKLFFKKLPNPCEFCQDFYGPPFFPEDTFWKLYNPQNNEKIEDIDFHTPIVLIQFISDITESESVSFLLSNTVLKLHQLLIIGEGRIEERIKCGIITLYVSWTELREGFSSIYLESGMMLYHEYYANLMLQGISKRPPSQMSCKWDAINSSFKLENGKSTPTSPEISLWRIHLVYHLLQLLRTVLRVSPESSNTKLRKQCIGLMYNSYFLVTSLYDFIKNDIKTKALITSVVSTTEEVTYNLIRRLPSLFHIVSESINSNDGLFKIYIDMTGFLPSFLSLYTHVTTFYLFISKDSKGELIQKILSEYLEAFVHSVLKVLDNIVTIIEEIKISEKKINQEIDKAVTEYLEKIIMIKTAYYLLLAIMHCFSYDQSSVGKIPTLTYIRIYERLKAITEFAEVHFMQKSVHDHSYNFPENFMNSDVKKIPGSRNYIVVDFQEENEDDLFRTYITAVVSWLWHLSLTEALCSEMIVNPATREVFRICYNYDLWTIHSYMAICGMVFNFTIMHTHPVLNCLPLTISIIVKFISELKIPIEGYLLLFQAIREIYPKIITPSVIREVQQIIAPLRTILSSDLPMLKYYNYPLLKQVSHLNKKTLTVGEIKPSSAIQDENDTRNYFPKQLLKNLPLEVINKPEAYPGQAIFQAEARSIIKMVTPITHDGITKTRKNIVMHVKAGEADLLFLKHMNSSREERMSVLFSGVGSQIISHHYSVPETEAQNNKKSMSKLTEGFDRIMNELFDREHGLKK